MSEEKAERPPQLPDYESPVVMSLTRVQRGAGQSANCTNGGQPSSGFCDNGYSAIDVCDQGLAHEKA